MCLPAGNHPSAFHTCRCPGRPQAACLCWLPCALKYAPLALLDPVFTFTVIWTANLIVRMALGAILRGQTRHTLLCTVCLFCIQERKSSMKLISLSPCSILSGTKQGKDGCIHFIKELEACSDYTCISTIWLDFVPFTYSKLSWSHSVRMQLSWTAFFFFFC